MPVVSQTRTIFDATTDGGFSPVFTTGTQFYNGQGWHANQGNAGNSFTVLQLSKGSVGLLGNEKIVGVHLEFAIPGSIGWQGAGAALSQDPNAVSIVGHIEQDSFTRDIALDSGAFGDDSPLVVSFGSQNIATRGIYLTNVTLNLLVDTSLPNTPPPVQGCSQELQGNCDVSITYVAGYGVSCMQLGDTIKVLSDDIIPYNRIDLTFAGPVDIEVTCVENWQVTPIKINPYIIYESPVGKVVNSFGQDKYSDPSQIAISQLVTHLRIYNDWPGQQFTVYIKLVKIHSGDTTTDISTGVNYGPITDGLDGIKQAIDDESTNVGTIIQNGINNAIQNITGIPGDIVAGILKGIPDIVNAIVAQLINDFKTITFGGSQLEHDITNTIQNIATTEGTSAFNFLNIFLQKFIEQETSTLQFSFQQVNGSLQGLDGVLNTLLQGNYPNYETFETDLKNNVSTGTWLLSLQNIVTVFTSILMFVKAKTDIANIVTKQLLLSEYTPNINDLNTLVRGYYRNLIDYNKLVDYASKYGLDSTKVDELILANRTLPTLGEIKQMFMFGYISEQLHDSYLGQYGIAGPDIIQIKKGYQIIPPYTDLIRMGDKHVWDSSIPASFGQFAEQPQQMIDALGKWGISPQWANLLWGTHWSLPEPHMLFDMFHRGIINQAELNAALSYSDMLPFLRDRLQQLTYTLVSRVDIRRFHALGIYDEKDVYNAYIKLGFSPADAQDQTDFVIAYDNKSSDAHANRVRELTESQIIKALKEGIITQAIAVSKIQSLGYSQADAQFLVDMEIQQENMAKIDKKTQAYHDKIVNLVLQEFSTGLLSESDARNYLTGLGVPQNTVDLEIMYAQIERISNLKKQVSAEIEKAYKLGHINENEATNLLLSNGFTMGEVTTLMQEYNIFLSVRNTELSEKDLRDMAKQGIITPEQFSQELMNKGYTDQHILWLVQLTLGG